MRDIEQIFNFFEKIENLKSTLRYSVTTSGRKESSAEHSWRLSLMSFMIADQMTLDVNVNRAMKIAIVHDLAEAITGDIDMIKVAKGEVSKEEKEELEASAMEELRDLLPEKLGQEIFDLCEEYNMAETREAKYIKALDKIETLTQLVESGHKIYDEPELIANYADKAVRNFPELSDILKVLKLKLKEEFRKGDFEWKEEYNSL